MIGFFEKHKPNKVLRIGESIMAQGTSDEDWWYMALEKPSHIDWFFEQTSHDDRFIAVIEDDILEKIKSRFTCRWVLSCRRFYLPSNVDLAKQSLKISNLSPSNATHIFSHSNYKQYTSVKYIEDQILNGPSAGFFDGDLLAGWVLTHDDGALGALHVLDLYRRRGIARRLVINLIEKIRAQGLIPYTYVEETNLASLNLISSLGFKFDRKIHWVNLNR